MLQRSTHDAAVVVPDIPATVEPGETVDWPYPIAGFEPAEDQPAPEPDTPAKTTPKKRASSAAGEESTS